MKKMLPQDQALALIKAIYIPMGLITQMYLFRYVEEPNHSFENLIIAAKRYKAEGPMRLNRYHIVEESKKRYVFSVTNCIFMKPFADHNCPELKNLFCAVDHALYNIYSPNRIIFSRGGCHQVMSEGNNSCSYICSLME